jgi:hypothetical protein
MKVTPCDKIDCIYCHDWLIGKNNNIVSIGIDEPKIDGIQAQSIAQACSLCSHFKRFDLYLKKLTIQVPKNGS